LTLQHIQRTLQDIRSTGIGLDGVDGIWWRPALAPYQLPRSLHEQLLQAADAMFGFCDAAAIACDDDETARALVCHRLPRRDSAGNVRAS
jgi:hypothetical protein